MIIYDLCCDNEHRFEGWFRSAGDFEQQLANKLVCCPQCDSSQVRRIPSAVAIGGHPPAASEQSVLADEGGMAAAMMPGGTEVMAIYRQLVETIVNNSEDVGTAFAEEARRIHYNEAPERPIRGQASADECEALRDEGINVLSLPKINKKDIN